MYEVITARANVKENKKSYEKKYNHTCTTFVKWPKNNPFDKYVTMNFIVISLEIQNKNKILICKIITTNLSNTYNHIEHQFICIQKS